MNRSDAPAKQSKPFAINGQREEILPTTPAGDNTASYEQGFPPITMILKSAGGLPPKGQDMNQILFELSSLARWSSTGALGAFDSNFATAINGYPSGSLIISDDGNTIYVNTTEGNTANPNFSVSGWKSLTTYLGLSDAFLIKDKYLSASLNLNTLGGDGKYGIYAQPVTNNASLSNNYPTQEAGSLLVTPAANNGMQIYTTLSGNVWSRTSLDNTNTQWSAWVRPGFKTLDENTNLNYLGGVDKYGFYGQSVSNNATPENNYPVKEAGTLLVSPAAYNGLQVYITLSGLIWSRYSLDSTNTNWSQWVRQALKSELDDGLALKFDSSSLSTTGKALVAKSTVADMRTYLQLLSAAQRDVGTGANQIPDMNAFSGSIVSKGYQKFPGGLIIQWGINNASVGGTSGNGEDVSYAIPFPNGCLSLTATFDNGGPVIPSAAASLVDNVYFKLRCSEASGSYIFRWIALGF
ncbi:pyocin knob domain-containing protein [Citrobacter freundii]|nr:pyocin knob domain-containing protein [Citrobacter freundii]